MKFSVRPVSRKFALDRGIPIDRYYMEKFLAKNEKLIYGRVLEVGDNRYTKKIGGNKVTKSDILNIVQFEGTTILGDLETGENIPEEAFDCIILTQVIQVIYDVNSALKHTLKALKPGGTLLLTASGISQIWREPSNSYSEYWRFTDKLLIRLLSQFVPQDGIHVVPYGNVAVAKAFLDGLALHEVPKRILDYRDEDYQLLITARVSK